MTSCFAVASAMDALMACGADSLAKDSFEREPISTRRPTEPDVCYALTTGT
jgi:hypothetical protein